MMIRFEEVASMEYDDIKYPADEGTSGPLECAVRDDGMFSFMMVGDYTLEIIVPPETAYEFAKIIMERAEKILGEKE